MYGGQLYFIVVSGGTSKPAFEFLKKWHAVDVGRAVIFIAVITNYKTTLGLYIRSDQLQLYPSSLVVEFKAAKCKLAIKMAGKHG